MTTDEMPEIEEIKQRTPKMHKYVTRRFGHVLLDCCSAKNVSQDFLPLNPKRLISLWDMIRFLGIEAIAAIGAVEYVLNAVDESAKKYPAKTLDSESRKSFSEMLADGDQLCQRLGLSDTITRKRELYHVLKHHKSFNYSMFVNAMSGIYKALDRELSAIDCAFITNDKSKFFEREDLFGAEVSFAFPSAQLDIKSAGNCLASDLNTAAVFHLMRVVEAGMRAFAIHLKVKIKDRPIHHAGWDQLINLIEKSIGERLKKYETNTKRNRKALNKIQFFKLCSNELKLFKDIWRDNVMHTGSPYNAEEAQGVFIRVRDFMQRLSLKISD
jgi:hypothetical protein